MALLEPSTVGVLSTRHGCASLTLHSLELVVCSDPRPTGHKGTIVINVAGRGQDQLPVARPHPGPGKGPALCWGPN